jgi:L-ascorbate metabolism protein UlaG (beta-lactamase superfamily)
LARTISEKRGKEEKEVRFRWLGNSCIEVEGKKRILIDPAYCIEPKGPFDYILITHEHKDHFREESKGLCDLLLAPRSADEEFGLKAIRVRDGEKYDNIRVVDCVCYGSREAVGFIIENDLRLIHLGDCFDAPDIQGDILFVPIFKEYHQNILDSIKRCGVRLVFPFHFNPEKEEKLELASSLIEKIKGLGIKADKMHYGEWIDPLKILESPS